MVRRDGLRRREEILDAALACFAEGGTLSVTLEQILARAGASPSSVYHHFGGRQGVALALLQRCLTRLFARLEAAVAAEQGAEARVTAMVRAHLDWVEAEPAEASFMYQMSGAPLGDDDRARHLAFKSALYAPLLARFVDFVASGEIPALSPPMYDVILMGPTHELSRRVLAGAPGLDLESARALLPRVAWAAMQGAKTAR
ncbi:MAG: TetR/AcrR family transcriptional regulator [Polyangiales bacterium]